MMNSYNDHISRECAKWREKKNKKNVSFGAVALSERNWNLNDNRVGAVFLLSIRDTSIAM